MHYKHEPPPSVSYQHIGSHTALKAVYFLTTETVKSGENILYTKDIMGW